MIRRPPRSTLDRSSAASDVYKRQDIKEKKRPKERKISFVINKVMEWRKLYTGMIDDNGQIIKYSLEDAADKVGISKKSLDDYMLQLRLGKKYGFNFHENKDNKIGILRNYIKDHRKNEGEKGDSGDEDKPAKEKKERKKTVRKNSKKDKS
eukprot:TRINITY_DN3889_c0_g1_i12.p1 TRINITY_DN3889_c0_g1~~TRINITY_DN3889_c0_g1_i12.p1  ORF type:complete len:159 (+),score=75.03 TRINITY_DN3889_c0_g1_i12:26-478(+)